MLVCGNGRYQLEKLRMKMKYPSQNAKHTAVLTCIWYDIKARLKSPIMTPQIGSLFHLLLGTSLVLMYVQK